MNRALFIIAMAIALAGCISLLKPTGIDSPQRVSRLLEQRWSVDCIRAFCISETRADPMCQNLVLMGDKVWRGRIHQSVRDEIGDVTWYADVRSNKVHELSLNVTKGADHWTLEIIDSDTLASTPITRIAVIDMVVARSLYEAISLQFSLHSDWGRGAEPTSEADRLFRMYYALMRDVPVLSRSVEVDVTSGKPTKWIQYFGNEQRDVLVVCLDESGRPAEFLLNGKKDEFLKHMYNEFLQNWSSYLDKARAESP